MPNLIKNPKAGFTMIETLVAIFILLLAISDPLYFVSQSLQSAYYARDQVTAFYLTQESVELIKNIRDTNALDATNCTEASTWLSCNGYPSEDLLACTGANGCVVGLTRNKEVYIAGCSSASDADCLLYEQAGTGVDDLQFAYDANVSSWEPARFQRRVYLTVRNEADYPGGSEAEIRVVIEWRSGAVDREFVVRQNITNWVPIYPLIP